MKRTRVTSILALFVVGLVSGALIEVALAAAGRPIIVPPLSLAIALAVIGAVVVALAIPVKNTTSAKAVTPVDPFYATRVLVLAKACALTAALAVGFAVGLLLYLLTRTVIAVGSLGSMLAMLVGAALLLSGGLVAEHLCRLPPGDKDRDGQEPPTATAAH